MLRGWGWEWGRRASEKTEIEGEGRRKQECGEVRPSEGHALTRKEGRAGPRAAEEPRKVNKYAVKGSKTGLKNHRGSRIGRLSHFTLLKGTSCQIPIQQLFSFASLLLRQKTEQKQL